MFLPTCADADADSDSEFLADFLASRLDGSRFNHRAHLRAAWLLLQRHPLDEAVVLCVDAIRRLATRLGVPGKFHHTRTEALMRLMAHGGAARLDWDDFVRHNRTLVDDARGLLARHYSAALLDAPDARERFVAPDLLPLPR